MSGLPKISHPVINLRVPSTGETRRFRPFVAREEKILLMAKESGELRDIMTAVVQVVQNCNVDSLDVSSLATYDVDYLFLKLRAASVDNVAKAAFRDNEDEEVRTFDVDLDGVEIKHAEKRPDNTRKIGKDVTVELQDPRASMYTDPEVYADDDDALIRMIAACIRSVWNGDAKLDFATFPAKDRAEWIEDLDMKTLEWIKEYISTIPGLYHVIEYKNSNGNDRRVEMRSLHDFFIFR